MMPSDASMLWCIAMHQPHMSKSNVAASGRQHLLIQTALSHRQVVVTALSHLPMLRVKATSSVLTVHSCIHCFDKVVWANLCQS